MDPIFVLSELQKKGLTQSAIATELECSQPTVSDMLSGKAGIKRPSFKLMSNLQSLASKHGVDLAPTSENSSTT